MTKMQKEEIGIRYATNQHYGSRSARDAAGLPPDDCTEVWRWRSWEICLLATAEAPQKSPQDYWRKEGYRIMAEFCRERIRELELAEELKESAQ